jgi:hypothetical protein
MPDGYVPGMNYTQEMSMASRGYGQHPNKLRYVGLGQRKPLGVQMRQKQARQPRPQKPTPVISPMLQGLMRNMNPQMLMNLMAMAQRMNQMKDAPPMAGNHPMPAAPGTQYAPIPRAPSTAVPSTAMNPFAQVPVAPPAQQVPSLESVGAWQLPNGSWSFFNQ